MRNSDAILNCLVNIILAPNPVARKKSMEELEQLRQDNTICRRDPEEIVRRILLEISAPDHMVGHPYIVSAVLMIVEDWKWIDNITYGLYPKIASDFDTSPSRAERAIRNAIEVAWSRAPIECLEKYFGNIVSPDKGKPTNGEFLARMANIVKMELKR